MSRAYKIAVQRTSDLRWNIWVDLDASTLLAIPGIDNVCEGADGIRTIRIDPRYDWGGILVEIMDRAGAALSEVLTFGTWVELEGNNA